jgi:hypothetical protein
LAGAGLVCARAGKAAAMRVASTRWRGTGTWNSWVDRRLAL